MNRRPFAPTVIALAALLGLFDSARVADAQQPTTPRRIGVILGSSSPESELAQAFRQGLRDAGYSEGRDVVIEWRTAR